MKGDNEKGTPIEIYLDGEVITTEIDVETIKICPKSVGQSHTFRSPQSYSMELALDVVELGELRESLRVALIKHNRRVFEYKREQYLLVSARKMSYAKRYRLFKILSDLTCWETQLCFLEESIDDTPKQNSEGQFYLPF